MHNIELKNCRICEGPLELVLGLPALPLTGLFRAPGVGAKVENHDQAWMLCPRCGHAQLARALPPATLYGQRYGFRTSASHTATKGSEFFASYLARLAPGRRFERVLEFGCSDAVLLRLLADRANRLLGVDPVLRGREDELAGSNFKLVGAEIDEADVEGLLGGTPDLVVSQHTMEHLPDPKATLARLLAIADERTLFVLEFPCLDPLLEQLRFDQVFHQHVHYFSLDSFVALLEQLGGRLLDFTFHYTYWGAILVAFRKGGDREAGAALHRKRGPEKSVRAITDRLRRFRMQMEVVASALSEVEPDRLFGYGAALMLPVLGYHLGTDFGRLRAVLDDDPEKDGIEYANLPVRVRNPAHLDLTELTIILTAMDNRRPILKRLADRNPKRIINPLCFI